MSVRRSVRTAAVAAPESAVNSFLIKIIESGKKKTTKKSSKNTSDKESCDEEKETLHCKRNIDVVIKKDRQSDVKRQKRDESSSSSASLARKMLDGGWNHLYDNHISKNLEHLRELAVDTIMHFCSSITNRVVVKRIVDFIEPLYNMNFYHSFEHAVHVLCNCSFFLTQVHEIFDEVEKLAILYAALIHDVEHMGVTNMALINKRHELAKKYHHQSVAEMNSLSIGLGLLERKEYNLISTLSQENHRKFTDFVIDLVLCTDIADMYKKQMLYLRLRDQYDEETGRLRIDNSAGKLALLMLILRSSDVGSSMQSLETSHVWVHNYYHEVKLASMRGDGPFFDDDAFFTQQIKYIEGHSMKLIDHLANTGRIETQFIHLLRDNCNNNQRDWIRCGREMLQTWGEEETLVNHTLLGDTDAT